MPNYNLGAIWGPSLLTVDSMEASTYSQTSTESDVCRDLIDFYMYVLITCFHESSLFYVIMQNIAL